MAIFIIIILATALTVSDTSAAFSFNHSSCEQECVFVWLNVGCVLHLQVADSIPAQVSGSQSVFCVCVCVLWLSPILPSFDPLFVPPSSSLRATSSFPSLETLAWIRLPCPALPPCSSLLLLLLLPLSFRLPVQP